MSDINAQADDVDSICPTLILLTGGVVTWWARCEHVMWGDIQNLISRNQQLKSLKEFEEVQISSSRRVKQWRRVHQRVYADRSEIVEETAAIATEALEILDDRNVLVHGMWDAWGNKDPHVATVHHTEPPKKGVTMLKTYKITEDQIDELCSRAYHLYHRLVQLHMNLFMTFGGQIQWSIKGKAD